MLPISPIYILSIQFHDVFYIFYFSFSFDQFYYQSPIRITRTSTAHKKYCCFSAGEERMDNQPPMTNYMPFSSSASGKKWRNWTKKSNQNHRKLHTVQSIVNQFNQLSIPTTCAINQQTKATKTNVVSLIAFFHYFHY